MSETTSIQWCDATFNPWEGCTKVSEGCRNCYAETRSKRFKHGNWGPGAPCRRTSAANWSKPLTWNRAPWRLIGLSTFEYATSPRRPRVFCASLADWLDEEVPIEWLADLLKLIHETPNLDWLLLTKRPENWITRIGEAAHHAKERKHPSDRTDWPIMLMKWLAPLAWAPKPPDQCAPANVWFGVSVEDQKRAQERIPRLLEIPARVRFVSFEPLLGPVRLSTAVAKAGLGGQLAAFSWAKGLDWVIVGGESGPKARPCRVEHVRSIVEQCRMAGIAPFVKQLGADPVSDDARDKCVVEMRHPKGGELIEWPEDLRVREFPALDGVPLQWRRSDPAPPERYAEASEAPLHEKPKC